MNIWRIFQALLPTSKKLPERVTADQIGEMISSGKVVIVRNEKHYSRYPNYVAKKIQSLAGDDILSAVKESADKIVAAEEWSCTSLHFGTGSSPLFSRTFLYDHTSIGVGIVQSASLTVYEEKDSFEIWLAVDLFRPCGGKDPVVYVQMFAHNNDPRPYPKSEEDGRCIHCEGWGCWTCNFSGGY